MNKGERAAILKEIQATEKPMRQTDENGDYLGITIMELAAELDVNYNVARNKLEMMEDKKLFTSRVEKVSVGKPVKVFYRKDLSVNKD